MSILTSHAGDQHSTNPASFQPLRTFLASAVGLRGTSIGRRVGRTLLGLTITMGTFLSPAAPVAQAAGLPFQISVSSGPPGTSITISGGGADPVISNSFKNAASGFKLLWDSTELIGAPGCGTDGDGNLIPV